MPRQRVHTRIRQPDLKRIPRRGIVHLRCFNVRPDFGKNRKNTEFFPRTPDNGGYRRGLVCPANAKTHFRFPVALTRFQPTARLSGFGKSGKSYSFSARIFGFYHYNTPTGKKQLFPTGFSKVFYFKNKLAILYSASAASIMPRL